MKTILICIISALFIIACKPKQTDSILEEEVVPVSITTASIQQIPIKIDIISNLIPWEEANLAPQSPGRIDRIFVKEGARVTKGMLLVQMDAAQLEQSKVQLKQFEDEVKRLDTLRNIGAVSLQQYEQSLAQFEIAQSQHQQVLANTQIRAPFSGIISQKHMNEGEVFTLSPSPTGSPAILTITMLSNLKSTIDVSEAYFPRIKMGMTATVNASVYPNQNFEGKISNIFPTIDPASRTFTVELKVPNSKDLLRPGMSARINLSLDTIKVMAVPRAALLNMHGTENKLAFIVEENIAKRRILETGVEYDELIEVISGLRQGERIVISGQGKLQDGMRVNVVEN
jgi:membrane fusion protein, multidrug efflux system